MNLNNKIIFEKGKIVKHQKNDKTINTKNVNYKINSCQQYGCILENLKQKRIINLNLFSPSKECLDIRFNFYNKLSKSKFEIQPNLTSKQLHEMKRFLREKPFSVIQCDKNIGMAIISNDLLDSLCVSHLSDIKIYVKLDSNPINDTIISLRNILHELQKEKQLKISLNSLIPKNPQIGKFRILAKLHKDKFGVRPIINNTNHVTSQLCKLIDLIIQPILRNTETYLKDSQHLLQKCNNLNVSCEKLYLYSMDFESLYTNIIKTDAVNLITDFVKNFLDSNYLTTYAFYVILNLIFDYNVFTYKHSKLSHIYYKQINGLAMGCICGPSVASLFVYVLENKWLCIHKPLFYSRFIDDIILFTVSKIHEEDFKSNFLNLKLNIIEAKTINFLDLNISFDTCTKKINFSLFIKPTNTFCYLHVNSNHLDFIFRNIPKSLFIRIRRICTKYTDYLYFSRKLIVQLLNRGYNFSKLISLAISIGNIDRNILLPYKNKVSFNEHNKSIFFGTEFNKQFGNLNQIVSESFNMIVHNHSLLNNYKLKLFNSMAKNIFSLFVHNKNNFNNFYKNTSACCSLICKIC